MRSRVPGFRILPRTPPTTCTPAPPVQHRPGHPPQTICVTEDATRVVQLEHELVRQERLAVAGRLVAKFHHEINNPLVTILGMAEMMLHRSSRMRTSADVWYVFATEHCGLPRSQRRCGRFWSSSNGQGRARSRIFLTSPCDRARSRRRRVRLLRRGGDSTSGDVAFRAAFRTG